MNSRKKLSDLTMGAMVVSALCGEEYTGMGLHLPRSKGRPGTLVCCHACGAGSGVTLYNDGNRKICARCREKSMRRRRK